MMYSSVYNNIIIKYDDGIDRNLWLKHQDHVRYIYLCYSSDGDVRRKRTLNDETCHRALHTTIVNGTLYIYVRNIYIYYSFASACDHCKLQYNI